MATGVVKLVFTIKSKPSSVVAADTGSSSSEAMLLAELSTGMVNSNKPGDRLASITVVGEEMDSTIDESG